MSAGPRGASGKLRSLGADPAKMLTDVELDANLFDDPDNRIPAWLAAA